MYTIWPFAMDEKQKKYREKNFKHKETHIGCRYVNFAPKWALLLEC